MDSFFEISKRGSSVKTEILAGLTTFFSMAYIIVVIPNQITGFTAGLDSIWNSVYIGSILVAAIGTLIMSLYAKMPLAQACGMGLNSFFFVSFILPEVLNGGDPIRGYHAGLVIVLLSGLIFFLLSVTGLRVYIAKSMPTVLKGSISVGIGLFIAFIGFQNSGIIQDNPYTLTQLVDIHGAISGGGILSVLPAMLAFLGFILISALGKLNIKGNVIIGILIISALYYVFTGTVPPLDFSRVGRFFTDFRSIGLFGVFSSGSWSYAFSQELVGGIFGGVMYVIAFVMVDMFDTIGTLYATASESGMLDDNGDPIALEECMMADATATAAGATLGTSTCTTVLESAAGIAAGGRTGLTSLTVAICFLLCMFLSPLASLIPSCATSAALIYVGVLMMESFKKIDFADLSAAATAFMTIISMVLTYSIANGIGIGAITYSLLTIFTGRFRKSDIMITIVALLFAIRFVMITM